MAVNVKRILPFLFRERMILLVMASFFNAHKASFVLCYSLVGVFFLTSCSSDSTPWYYTPDAAIKADSTTDVRFDALVQDSTLPDFGHDFDAADETNVSDTSILNDGSSIDSTGADAMDAKPAPVKRTIQQIQNGADPDHPSPSTTLTLDQSGMIALSPRMLIGSTKGDSSNNCRYAFWVSDGSQADFSAIQVQELIQRGSAVDCFAVEQRLIPADLVPGDRITLIESVYYNERCSASLSSTCTNGDFEQSQLFGPSALIRLPGVKSPTPRDVAITNLGKASDGSIAPLTLKTEGQLLRISNVRLTVAKISSGGGTLTEYHLSTTSDVHTERLVLLAANFKTAACVRAYLDGKSGKTLASITGILLPEFGQWRLRLRDEKDLPEVQCQADAGI